jgi:tetratricopeptide (TPR) repeat protein
MYRVLLSTYPDLPMAHQYLARIYQEMGRYDDAIAEYTETIRIDPHQILAYDGLIWLLRNRIGDVDAIIKWASREIAVDENHLWPHLNLCWAYLGKGNGERAVAAARRAVEIEPNNLYCHYHLGHALQIAGEYQDAARSFEEVLALAPNETYALYHAGDALERAGEVDGARTHFTAFKHAVEELIDGEPEDTNYPFWLDYARIRLGEEPLTALSTEQLASSDPNFNWDLAQLFSLSGRPQEAIDRLERALANGIKNPIWVLCHPNLDPLHDEPRYQALKRRTLKLENG